MNSNVNHAQLIISILRENSFKMLKDLAGDMKHPNVIEETNLYRHNKKIQITQGIMLQTEILLVGGTLNHW